MTGMTPWRWLMSRVFILGLCLAPCSFAGLIFEGVAQASGGGFGGSITLLSLQATGTERGCISWNGTTQVLGSAACITGYPPESAPPGGDEKTGANQSQIRTIAQTGALNGNQIRFVFDANEGGGSSFHMTLADVPVSSHSILVWHSESSTGAPLTPRTIFDPTGAKATGQAPKLVFTDVQNGQNPVLRSPNFQGVGAQSQLATKPDSGPDSLSVVNFSSQSLGEVPEPSTWISLATGLLAFAFWRRRRGAPSDG